MGLNTITDRKSVIRGSSALLVGCGLLAACDAPAPEISALDQAGRAKFVAQFSLPGGSKDLQFGGTDFEHHLRGNDLSPIVYGASGRADQSYPPYQLVKTETNAFVNGFNLKLDEEGLHVTVDRSDFWHRPGVSQTFRQYVVGRDGSIKGEGEFKNAQISEALVNADLVNTKQISEYLHKEIQRVTVGDDYEILPHKIDKVTGTVTVYNNDHRQGSNFSVDFVGALFKKNAAEVTEATVTIKNGAKGQDAHFIFDLVKQELRGIPDPETGRKRPIFKEGSTPIDVDSIKGAVGLAHQQFQRVMRLQR